MTFGRLAILQNKKKPNPFLSRLLISECTVSLIATPLNLPEHTETKCEIKQNDLMLNKFILAFYCVFFHRINVQLEKRFHLIPKSNEKHTHNVLTKQPK